jgi:hypothetical protein
VRELEFFVAVVTHVRAKWIWILPLVFIGVLTLVGIEVVGRVKVPSSANQVADSRSRASIKFSIESRFAPIGVTSTATKIVAVGSRVNRFGIDLLIADFDGTHLRSVVIPDVSKSPRGYFSEQPRVSGDTIGLLALHQVNGKSKFAVVEIPVGSLTPKVVDVSGLTEPARSLRNLSRGLRPVGLLSGFDECFFAWVVDPGLGW